jgi:hypothetical protein
MELYRINVVKAIAYFLNGVKRRDETLIEAIENPTKSGMFDETMKIKAVFKHNGFDVIKTGAFCLRNSFF